ncbi:MAG: hypothetical protein ACMUHB_06865 [Thermoplasmatota archaeon]
MTIWLGVSLIEEDELDTANNEITHVITVLSVEDEGPDITLFIIIGAGVLLLLVGAGLYVWKFGLPLSPPPDAAEEPSGEIARETVVDVSAPEFEEAPVEEGPVLEMSLEEEGPGEALVPESDLVPMPAGEEEVIVAEIVEDEDTEDVPPRPVPPGILDDEDEEGMIPEV